MMIIEELVDNRTGKVTVHETHFEDSHKELHEVTEFIYNAVQHQWWRDSHHNIRYTTLSLKVVI